MATVIIVIHLMVIVALVAVVLLQRSDGGALGIGGSSGFLTTRGSGNVLTRSTAILAAAFFATSIALTLLARVGSGSGSILDTAPLQGSSAPASGEGGILKQLEPLGEAGAPSGGAAGTVTAPAPAPAAPAVPSSQ